MYRLTNTTVKRVLPYRVFPIFDTRKLEKKIEKKVFDKQTNSNFEKKELFCKIEESNINMETKTN